MQTRAVSNLALHAPPRQSPSLFLSMDLRQLVIGDRFFDRRAGPQPTTPCPTRAGSRARWARCPGALLANHTGTPTASSFECEDGAIPGALSLPWPRNALLDETSAQVSVDKPSFGLVHALPQRGVSDALAALEPPEGFRAKYPHATATLNVL
jgi:hypothetical protein